MMRTSSRRPVGWRMLTTAFLLLVAGCVAPPRQPFVGEKTTLALCEDYPEETRTLDKAKADLEAAHRAGATALRIAFGWDAMEPERGRFDWAFWDDYVRIATRNYGIRLIPYVCYTPKWAASDAGENYWRSPPRDAADFGRFVETLVRRYGASIHSWELWNEPDNQAYWLGTPHQFAELVRAGSEAVRRADPTATVVLGGIAGEVGFLAALLRDERIGVAVDVVNIHSYYETWHPNRIEQLPQYIANVAGLVRDTGGRQPVWMAETGYSSVGPRPETSSMYRPRFVTEHSEDAQAAALVRSLVTVVATGQVPLIAWYRINDLGAGQDVIGDDNNRRLGLRRLDGTPKPAFAAFSYLAHLFSQAHAAAAVSVETTAAHDAEPVVKAFRLADGRCLVAAWLSLPDQAGRGGPTADDRTATVRVTVPGLRASDVRIRDARGIIVPRGRDSWRNRRGAIELTIELHAAEVRLVEVLP